MHSGEQVTAVTATATSSAMAAGVTCDGVRAGKGAKAHGVNRVTFLTEERTKPITTFSDDGRTMHGMQRSLVVERTYCGGGRRMYAGVDDSRNLAIECWVMVCFLRLTIDRVRARTSSKEVIGRQQGRSAMWQNCAPREERGRTEMRIVSCNSPVGCERMVHRRLEHSTAGLAFEAHGSNRRRRLRLVGTLQFRKLCRGGYTFLLM